MSGVAVIKIIVLHVRYRRLANVLYKQHIQQPVLPFTPTFTHSEAANVEPTPTPTAAPSIDEPDRTSSTFLKSHEGLSHPVHPERNTRSPVLSSYQTSILYGRPSLGDIITPAIFFGDQDDEDEKNDSIDGDTGSWTSHRRSTHSVAMHPTFTLARGIESGENPRRKWKGSTLYVTTFVGKTPNVAM